MTQERRRSPVTALLATDRQKSTLHHQASDKGSAFSYTPFGYDPNDNGKRSLLGFTGEPRTNQGYYLLGSGYRCYNSTLMRFNSPDSYSPFGSGGLNAYIFCEGDPINYTDPTGHIRRATITNSRSTQDLPPSYSIVMRPTADRPTASSVFEPPLPGYYEPFAPPLDPFSPSATANGPYEPSAPPITNEMSNVLTSRAPTRQRPPLTTEQLKQERKYKDKIAANNSAQKNLTNTIRKKTQRQGRETNGSDVDRILTREIRELKIQWEKISADTTNLNNKIDALRQT